MKKVFLVLALCPFKAHASIIRPDANLVEWFLGSAIAGTILYTMAYGGGKLFEVLMRVFEPKRWENAKKTTADTQRNDNIKNVKSQTVKQEEKTEE